MACPACLQILLGDLLVLKAHLKKKKKKIKMTDSAGKLLYEKTGSSPVVRAVEENVLKRTILLGFSEHCVHEPAFVFFTLILHAGYHT